MPPKGHRAAGTGLLRSHSRSSSTSKLGANLQFTQKDPPQQKLLDKTKKNGHSHDVHTKPSLARANSGQRVQSKEQVQPFIPRRAPAPQNQKPNGTRPKAGFTVSSPGDDDDDEWVSSESGAVTPSNNDSDSDESDSPALNRPDAERSPHTARPSETEASLLPRVETARPSDYNSAAMFPAQRTPEPTKTGVRTSTLPPIKTEPPIHLQHIQVQNHPSSAVDSMPQAFSEAPSPNHQSARSAVKRQSSTRPPSTHSVSGRSDQPLRPHPLIRGHSYGQVYPQKPAPLEPLAVIPDTATSTSPSSSMLDSSMHQLSTSPSSGLKTTTGSPTSPDRAPSSSQYRRTSVSSARSVATLPVHNLRESGNWGLSDRKRTLSAISQSSSSAALSSLVHLPTVTRPPSPQAISFFPPINPHANIEAIHPLLPPPYLNNHLTVLARRTPIKESFDRVIRAKQVRT